MKNNNSKQCGGTKVTMGAPKNHEEFMSMIMGVLNPENQSDGEECNHDCANCDKPEMQEKIVQRKEAGQMKMASIDEARANTPHVVVTTDGEVIYNSKETHDSVFIQVISDTDIAMAKGEQAKINSTTIYDTGRTVREAAVLSMQLFIESEIQSLNPMMLLLRGPQFMQDSIKEEMEGICIEALSQAMDNLIEEKRKDMLAKQEGTEKQ